MQTLSSLSPQLAIHLFAAVGAFVLGPFAIWARLVGKQRPKLHRAFGYAWVTLMITTAISALFIRSQFSLSWAGFSFIHLLIPLTLTSLVTSFWALAKGNILAHRRRMITLYISACMVAGAFTLAPGR